MLPESRLYSFLDNDRGFAVYFLEGQKLIQELALIHDFQPAGFAWYRDLVLSLQPMISQLKRGEGLGFYLDAEQPYFRLKLETGFHGQMRSLLLPADFREVPETVSGVCRMVKTFPDSEMTPYTSLIELRNNRFREIINLIIERSFQMAGEVLVGEHSDQSIMISALPDPSRAEEQTETVKQYRLAVGKELTALLNRALLEEAKVIEAFSKLGFKFLVVRPVYFQCTCNEERLLATLKHLMRAGDLMLGPEEEEISARCDYCNTAYSFPRAVFEAWVKEQ